MKVALVNPPWTFEGSIYFGCREAHLPLEYGYAQGLLEQAGHETLLVDAHLEDLRTSDVRKRLEAFEPTMTVVTSAPSYLFWRCAPPELRVPQQLVSAVRDVAGTLVVVGPHASTTPRATLRKLGAHVAVMGECEQVLARLASCPRGRWGDVDSIAVADGAQVRIQGGQAACDMEALPALRWPQALVDRHGHHHHRFDAKPSRPGAEVESSRGCPYHCTFCAKDAFRNAFRRRPLDVVLREIDALAAQGVGYLYFVDEIFLPDRRLLEALCERDLAFGVQLRIDNWTEETLDLLGRAGCVSIEASIEGVTPEGRARHAKKCLMSTDQLVALFAHAKARVPFVQANLVEAQTDPPDEVARFRQTLHDHGVWANEPAPMFPYPGSPDYVLRWGPPDDAAWERAHIHYLANFRAFSDVPDQPLSLSQLELPDGR